MIEFMMFHKLIQYNRIAGDYVVCPRFPQENPGGLECGPRWPPGNISLQCNLVQSGAI
jgi:hypothetical protein